MAKTVDDSLAPERASAVAIPERPLADDVPADLRDAWEMMLATAHADDRANVRAVYRAVVLQEPWKRAAAAEGADPDRVWNLARQSGLAGRRRKVRADGYRRIVTLTQDLLEERIRDDPKSMATKDLAVAMGIAEDKLGNLSEESGASYVTLLDRVASALAAGGKLTLELSVAPAASPSFGDSIDVTPDRETISDRGSADGA